MAREWEYPPARRGDDADEYHGETVPDPYRWLEDPDSEETIAWVRSENDLTDALLAASPARETLRGRLAELWGYPRFGVPFERGGRWFQSRQLGLQDHPVLYVMDAPDDDGRPLLDANLLSEDGTVAVTSLAPSDDGRLLAYGTSTAGSDWRTWRVRVVDTGDDLPDVVEWSKYSSVAWRKDGSGYYYAALERPDPGKEYTAENRSPWISFHRLGTSQADDEIVFVASEPDWLPDAEVTDDDRYLVISVRRGTFPETRLSVLDLQQPGRGFRPLAAGFEFEAAVVGNEGTTFFLLTDHRAGRRRVVAADLENPAPEGWRDVIPESGDTLLSAHLFGGRLVCHCLRDACSRLRVHSLTGEHLRDIPLPAFASLAGGFQHEGGIEGRPGSDVVHFGVVSFADSGSLWRHHLSSEETALVREPAAPVDPAGFATDQVFVTSDDGTRVPLFLTRRRDVQPAGEVPVILYGYGGFDIPISPFFSVTQAVWMERGGLLAVASLRGGGEYGREWHDAGRLANKQKVFDDFCACARWLAGSGWSRPGRIAINGGSNGGLLVGACLTQHPELFGAAVAQVGVLDMLRFHKFTIGWAWKSDFGDPDDPEQYRWLRAYSPLHNVEVGRSYPATLLMTGDHDDRVVPGHSFKFAAALQAAQGGPAPILVRVETAAGHGQGKPTSKQIAEQADFLAFLELALELALERDSAREENAPPRRS